MMNDDTKQSMDDDEIYDDESFDDEGFEDEGFDDEFDDGEFGDLEDEYGAEGGGEEWGEEFDEEFDDGYEEGAAAGKKSGKGNLVIIGAGAVVAVIALVMLMGGGDKPAPSGDQPAAQQQAAQQGGTDTADAGMPPQPSAPVSQRDMIYGRTGEFKQDDTASIDNPTGGMMNDDAVMDEVKEELSSVEFTDEIYTGEDEYEEDLPNAAQEQLEKWGVTEEDQADASGNSDVLTPVPNLGLGEQDDVETVDMFDDQPDAVSQIEDISDGPSDQAMADDSMSDDSNNMFNDDSSSDDMPPQGVMSGDDRGDDMFATTTTTQQQPAQSSGDVDKLSKKMDLLFARLDQVESKLSKSGSSSNSASDAEIAELRKTVRDLEKKVARMQSKPAPAPVPKVTSSDDTPVYAPPPISSSTTSSVTSSSTKVASVSTANMNHKWTLRAAQTGSAMVSLAGHNEMRDVKVGDRLAGIGRVTEISLVNGKWVVQGTQGQITQ